MKTQQKFCCCNTNYQTIGAPAKYRHAPGFLKLILCGSQVCMFVCASATRLYITNGVMWYVMSPIYDCLSKLCNVYMVAIQSVSSVDVALELKHIIEISLTTVSFHRISHFFHFNIYLKLSNRRNISVIQVAIYRKSWLGLQTNGIWLLVIKCQLYRYKTKDQSCFISKTICMCCYVVLSSRF